MTTTLSDRSQTKRLPFESRQDNLVCAAVATEQAIIVKTVMVNWKERDNP
jgi:hypothetical protein